MVTMVLLLPLLLLLLLVQPFVCWSVTFPWNDDVLGLIVFKADLGNPDVLGSWMEEDQSPCAWDGIQCSNASGRVVSVVLDGLSLSGPLGRGLLKLDQLQSLSLSSNNLSGSIPAQIQALQELQLLNLAHNSLTGGIPESLGSLPGLQHLDLSHNRLRGPLPGLLFASASRLELVDVSGNALNGEIPSSIGNSSSLLLLAAAGNNFSGRVPAQVGRLSRLRSLNLSRNSLSGDVPPELLQCTRLQELDLGYNMLSGTPPPLPSSLSTLVLVSNSLSGTIPGWISNLTRLTDLNLGLNHFQGPIPASFASLASLKRLHLYGNRLEGDIPAAALASCTGLADINLSGNRLTGPVPEQLFVMLDLVYLALAGNLLTGELPTLSSNSLRRLDLSNNSLRGELDSVVQCPKLASINLSGNSLHGIIPPEVVALPDLEYLDLSSNELSGPLPVSFENATSLRTIRLQANMLDGPVPVELSSCTSLAYLDISHNNLTGGIPVELADLDQLKVLNLSHNHLSGQIPASFGEMQNITAFNVSYNSLAGPLPTDGVFRQLDASSFTGNLHLCGPPLEVECPAIPKPIVLDPNATSPIIGGGGGSGGGGGGRGTTSSRSRIVLSVSTIVAISAAALIALGIVVVSLLNLGKRAGTRRPRSSFYVVDSSLPPGSSPSEDVAIGKLVMFTDDSNNDDDMSNDELLPQAQALLNKDSELGRGSFGTVYRATLAAGRAVAVKKLTVAGLVQSQHEFEKRVQFLGRIQHANLVNFQGYYWTPKLQLLIYDFVACGNLHSRLHEHRQRFPWEDRLKVALGAAAALVYLHHRCRPRVVHANIKSANILLDEYGNARVSDYGLIKLLPSPRRRHEVMSKQQGALGYMAPECSIVSASSFKATDKSDVYAFGVVLLELVTGSMPLEYTEDDLVLVGDRCKAAVDSDTPFDCVDPRMGSYPEDEVLTVMKLGLVCTSHASSNRPSMAQVMQILELIKPLPLPSCSSSNNSSN